jgi:RHS repeat-associated protein
MAAEVIFGTVGRNGDPYFEGPHGVRDRFQGVSGNTCYQCNCYLHLPDGGKIWFQGTPDPVGPDGGPYTVYWTFTLMGIIDPYGQTTTVTYPPGDLSMTITEPAGRMLKIFWSNVTGATAVNRVEVWMTPSLLASTVHYYYSIYPAGGFNYSALTTVSYYPDGGLATYTYQNSNIASVGRPLIKTCVDPRYAGPMWQIAYAFQPNGTGVAYGQLQGEKYYDGTNIGAPVSSLYITGSSTRQETRGDGPHRTFSYASYQLTSATDFKGNSASQGYDSAGFVNSATDRNLNTTTFTNDPWTGNVTATIYPLTPSDNGVHATSQVVYSGSGCNTDTNNPYYVCGYTNAPRRKGKRGFSATYLRDSDKRVVTINYLDGGAETFTYNNFGQVLTHRLKVGGLETFTYNSRGLLTEYRDAYHLSTADPLHPNVPTSATPSLAYFHIGSGVNMDRVYAITDARGNTTNFTYNDRGQILTRTPQGVMNPVTYAYNPNWNGTVISVTNELQKTTSYTYDEYKRLTSVTLPPPNPGPSPNATTLSYDHTGQGADPDYTHAIANATRVILPSGKIARTMYDEDLLKANVIVGYGTSDAATAIFTYDNNGNLQTVVDPNDYSQDNGLLTRYFHDAQNRLTDVNDPMVYDQNAPHQNSNGHTISFTYDQANNILTELRTNNQSISYLYDVMNHVKQVTAPQDPSPTAVTKYTYYIAGDSSGLLQTMQDPHLVAINNGAAYTYGYDLMGRKTSVTYPPDSDNVTRSEAWTYDDAGNIGTFRDRTTKTQTFNYDVRNRMTGFSWTDGLASPETIIYDDASRVKEIDNNDAVIKNTYFDDNTLQSQQEWATVDPQYPRTVSYTYDADLNRSTMSYPNSDNFSYGYTGRNQPYAIQDTNTQICPIVYGYDPNGNMISSWEGGTVGTYAVAYNAMNRCTHISINFADVGNEGPRTFDYVYDKMNNRTSIQLDGGTAKTYAYDLAEQSTTETGSPTFSYDANGNLTGGTSYATNNLNEYTTFNSLGVSYDSNGNLKTYNGWTCYSDQQNRMTTATNPSTKVTETFKYDGLNRQISHTLNNVTTYNVWDGWNLIEEYATNLSVPDNIYVYGGRGEIVERMSSTGTILYFPDALGSTRYISDASGNALESYTYSRTGAPSFHSGDPTLPDSGQSAYGIRHLFHGQLWTQETGLNDYRNRVQLPAMGVFMQPDPIGFAGDPTHLYRFCGNNAFIIGAILGVWMIFRRETRKWEMTYLTKKTTPPRLPTRGVRVRPRTWHPIPMGKVRSLPP